MSVNIENTTKTINNETNAGAKGGSGVGNGERNVGGAAFFVCFFIVPCFVYLFILCLCVWLFCVYFLFFCCFPTPSRPAVHRRSAFRNLFRCFSSIMVTRAFIIGFSADWTLNCYLDAFHKNKFQVNIYLCFK